jgi:hypothetical protein
MKTIVLIFFQFYVYLIKRILQPKNIEFVEVNKSEQVADWFHELRPTQQKTIQKSREEIKRGEGISHQEVQRRVGKIIENKKH